MKLVLCGLAAAALLGAGAASAGTGAPAAPQHARLNTCHPHYETVPYRGSYAANEPARRVTYYVDASCRWTYVRATRDLGKAALTKR